MPMIARLADMMGRRLRLGMVGGGFDSVIGETHRIAFGADGLFELVAGAFSIDPAVAAETGRGLLIDDSRVYADFRDMARREHSRPDGIDAVLVATPPQLHAEVTLAFLKAGIDVICEKPLTRTLADAEALRTAVQASGQIFVLTHCYAAFPMVRHARDLVRAGALGRLRMVEAEFAGGAPGVNLEPDDPGARHWRFRASSMGRDAILGEVGTHAYHLMRYVSGLEPQRLSARLQTFARGREVFDNAYLDFDYPSGAVGRLWTSYVATGTQHGLSLRVYGEDASLEWREEDAEFLRLRPLREPERVLRAGQDETSDLVARSARFRPGHPEGYGLAFANLYVDAAMAIAARRSGGSPRPWLDHLPGIDDGVEGLRMIDAAARSAALDAAWVDLKAGGSAAI